MRRWLRVCIFEEDSSSRFYEYNILYRLNLFKLLVVKQDRLADVVLLFLCSSHLARCGSLSLLKK